MPPLGIFPKGMGKPPPEPQREATAQFGTVYEKEELKHLIYIKYLLATGRLDAGRQDR